MDKMTLSGRKARDKCLLGPSADERVVGNKVFLGIFSWHLSLPAILLYQHLLAWPMQLPSRIPIESQTNPFTSSINPPQLFTSGTYSPYNYHNNSVNSPSVSKKQPQLANSRMDGPTQTLNLNDNVSFARNFKGRLLGSDPQQQINKQKVQDKYREQLRIQMEDDKRRKAAQKAKEEQEDLKLERKFYENIKIEAQKKANNKDEPNYFIMRSARGKRKQHKENENSPESHLNKSQMFRASKTQQLGKGDLLRRTLYDPPKIIKRGGYHNHSSLGNPQPSPNNPEEQFERTPKSPPLMVKMSEEEQLASELAAQQDRISKLLLFQQNMIRKLDYFKKEIYHTNDSLKLEEEYEKVKLKLRAKPINLQKIHSLEMTDGVEDILESSDMYKLPVISKHHRKIYEGERQIKKKKGVIPIDLNQSEKRKHLRSPVEQVHMSPSVQNDKNFSLPGSKEEDLEDNPDSIGIQADFD